MRKRFKTVVIFAVALAFLLVSTFAFAAETAKAKQWYVLKNKKEACSVSQHKVKPKTAIAGPFSTQKEAKDAKEKDCPKKK